MQHTILIRLPEVLRRVALSRSSVYLLITKGRFPRPVKVGARASRWVESDVDAWLQASIESSRQPTSNKRRHG